MIDDIKTWFRGIYRSWTMWFAVIVASFPAWESYLPYFGNSVLTSVIAVLMIVLRFKTTQSIADKGK